MELSRRKMLLVSFMLFSLFFGAGNLIFPPFLGQNAGAHMVPALAGFLATAVVLPVLGVIVVARFNGLDCLAGQVGARFSMVFTVLIYLSIGPGLGIPRAASVPFEMAVAPYLPDGVNTTICMVAYSLVFFLVALWLCMNPGKLVKRIGSFLTPSLLLLLCFLFFSFLVKGQTEIAVPQEAYQEAPFFKGFVEGYQDHGYHCSLEFRPCNRHYPGLLWTEGEKERDETHCFSRCICRCHPGIGLYDADLYGHVQLRRLCGTGKRCMDSSPDCVPALWRIRRDHPGSYFHTGLPDYLCGVDQFDLPVLLQAVSLFYL